VNRCHTLYYSALRADRAFDRAIKKAYGKTATRWTIPRSPVEPVKKAYGRKVAVDRARARACDVMRRG
jgi:hypothetical protein